MNRRAIISLVLVSIMALIYVLPAGAYYASATGQLRDSLTGEPWTWGAQISVVNCNSGNTVAGPFTVGDTGAFTIDLTTVNLPRLCFQIDFNEASNGEPLTQPAGPIDNTSASGGHSGTLGLGDIYTNTGPNAVTLQQVTTSAGSFAPALLALSTIVLGAVSLVAIRRRGTL
jgi:hypothetical protein